MRSILVFGLVLLLAFVGANAADKDGRYVVQGVTSCGKYIEETKNKNGWSYTATLNWVAGYITATNRFMPDTYSILGNSDIDSAMLWLENYCRSNPLKSISSGMTDLVIEIYPNRILTK